MFELFAASLLFAQATMPAAPLPSLDADRLASCRDAARRDPATAIVDASQWLAELPGGQRSDPYQCLGFAYTSLLRWEAAESVFLSARTDLPPSEEAARARLAAMAGNAALAGERFDAALAAFQLARGDADSANNRTLAGEIDIDRARALVGLGRLDEAASALTNARENAPQNVAGWLLSATLARRQENLPDARALIEVAAKLAPRDAEIGLEAGLIAALAGDDDAARQNWQAAIELAPQSVTARSARDYLAQLDKVEALP